MQCSREPLRDVIIDEYPHILIASLTTILNLVTKPNKHSLLLVFLIFFYLPVMRFSVPY